MEAQGPLGDSFRWPAPAPARYGVRARDGRPRARSGPRPWVALLVLACTLLAAGANAAVAGAQVRYARLQHACPPPHPGGATCFAIVRAPLAGAAAPSTAGAVPYRVGDGAAAAGPAGGLTPADLASAYGYGSSGGAGQTVAIVDAYDDPKIEKDLATFDSHYGFGECSKGNGCFSKVNQEGESGTKTLPEKDVEGWSEEISLDVETARAACQGCKILLVEANSASYENLAKAVDEAVKLGATEVSNSYGGPEVGIKGQIAAYNHPGVVITAASGDYGWDNWNYALEEVVPPAMPNAPASLPSVVSVGGTSLKLNEDGTRASETVWNDDLLGAEAEWEPGYVTGGGCSTLFGAQPWQEDAAGFAASGCASKRLAVDVSADGDPVTGFDIYDSFNFCGAACKEAFERHEGWQTFGGTSLGTPLVAALYALAGGAHGLEYPALTLYGHLGTAGQLYDVTQGGNGICDGQPATVCGHPNAEFGTVLDCEGTSACDARTGLDGPSGVGTPNGLQAFTPLFPTAVATPPAVLGAGTPAAFSSANSSDPYPGGRLTGYSWGWGDGQPASKEADPSHIYATPGTYTVTLSVADNYGLTSSSASVAVKVLTGEEAAKAKQEEEAARRKQEEEAAKKAREEAANKAREEAAAKKAGEEAAAKAKQEEEAAAQRRREAEQPKPPAVSGVASFQTSVPASRLVLLGGGLAVSRSGAVVIRISCTGGSGACLGTLTLRTLHLVTVGHRRVLLTLARGGFALAAGRTGTLTLRLSPAARVLLARAHSLRVGLSMASGQAQHTVTVTLRPAAAAHGKG